MEGHHIHVVQSGFYAMESVYALSVRSDVPGLFVDNVDCTARRLQGLPAQARLGRTTDVLKNITTCPLLQRHAFP